MRAKVKRREREREKYFLAGSLSLSRVEFFFSLVPVLYSAAICAGTMKNVGGAALVFFLGGNNNSLLLLLLFLLAAASSSSLIFLPFWLPTTATVSHRLARNGEQQQRRLQPHRQQVIEGTTNAQPRWPCTVRQDRWLLRFLLSLLLFLVVGFVFSALAAAAASLANFAQKALG